jgi:hypothetical protein
MNKKPQKERGGTKKNEREKSESAKHVRKKAGIPPFAALHWKPSSKTQSLSAVMSWQSCIWSPVLADLAVLFW